MYIQMLNKLYLPDEVDENKLRKLKYLVTSYKIVCAKYGMRAGMMTFFQNRTFADATSKNAFDRFSKLLEKQYADVFNGMSEEDSRQMESLKELFEFLDELVPEEPVNGDKRKRVTRTK